MTPADPTERPVKQPSRRQAVPRELFGIQAFPPEAWLGLSRLRGFQPRGPVVRLPPSATLRPSAYWGFRQVPLAGPSSDYRFRYFRSASGQRGLSPSPL